MGDDQYIYEITFNKRDIEIKENKLIRECYCQLEEYFDGKRKYFDIPLYIEGTDFL